MRELKDLLKQFKKNGGTEQTTLHGSNSALSVDMSQLEDIGDLKKRHAIIKKSNDRIRNRYKYDVNKLNEKCTKL